MASKEVLNALESLHRELEKLEPAIKHVETAQQITQTVKGIPQKHIELMSEVKNNDVKHKDDLKKIFVKELAVLSDENKKLQTITLEIQQSVKVEQEALLKLKNSIQLFYERVEKINFPDRLDKLGTNVTGIMTGIQSVQNRLDNIERSIADRLKDLSDYQKETRIGLLSSFEQIKSSLLDAMQSSAKKHQQLTFVTWVLVALIALLLILLRKA